MARRHGTAMKFVFQYFTSEKLHCGIHKLRDGFKLKGIELDFLGGQICRGFVRLSKSSIQ